MKVMQVEIRLIRFEEGGRLQFRGSDTAKWQMVPTMWIDELSPEEKKQAYKQRAELIKCETSSSDGA